MIIDAIREHFTHPPAEYGPTPFWFLNDELDEASLSSALEEMKSKRIAGVVIHPRTGMEVEYLSEIFWDRLRFICETLARLGMQGWIYDEYNWPSGPVGGKLLREHPEFRQVGLDYWLVPASQLGQKLAILPGELMGAFAIFQGSLHDKTEELKKEDFGAFLNGKALLFFQREMRAPLYATRCAPWTRAESGYLDLLNPHAVDEFMRLTHFEYDKRLKEFYGSPLVGIFTDEPMNYSALPYTPSMPEEFRKRFGRDLREALPSLGGRFEGISLGDHVRNRTNYFELARDLYVNSYFKKISEWASERGLIFTGHLGEEDMLNRLPATNISFYAPLSQMHMPGTDVLCDKHGYETEHNHLVHPNFNPKALSSTAHHAGAGRTLCEIWGGNGWSTPPETLKSVLNWAQACGVNFVNPHAVFMSLRGLRKRDFPASHFPPQPWWRFYDRFSEYIARLSFLNSQGTHVADTLFAVPMKSLWVDFDLRAKGNRLADFIEAASLTLLQNQLDFDYLFDEVVDSGKVAVEEDRIKIGEEEYSLLLLPLASVLPRGLLTLAEQFAQAGGKVIGIGCEMPTHDEYGSVITEQINTLFNANGPDNIAYHRLGAKINLDLEWLANTAKEFSRPDLIAEGELARNLIYLHRRTEEADCYFLANLSEKEGRTELAFRSKGRPQIWNPEDGSIKNVLAYKRGLEYTRISAWLHPNQALFFLFTAEPPVDHVESTNLELNRVTTDFADGYTSALEVRLNHGGRRYTRNVEQALPPILLPERWEVDYPLRNIFLLDAWEIEILSGDGRSRWSPGDESRLGLRSRLTVGVVRAAFSIGNALRKSFGGIKHPTTKYEPLDAMADVADKWCTLLGIDAAQFEQYEVEELLLKMANYVGWPMGYDYPPAGCEFAMSTVFHLEHIPDDLALVYENLEGGPVSITLNDVDVAGEPEPVFIWDASNRALPIARHVKEGKNHLHLRWRQPSFSSLFPSIHGIEPVCLVGRFWVKKGRIIEQKYAIPALPWSRVGLPNYIGTLTYKSSFKIPIQYMAQQLFIKFGEIGTVAEVKINGKHAGTLLWRPYTLDITGLIAQGENAIEVTVANTAANLLAEPIPAGIIGRPYIVPYWRHRIRFES